MKLSPIQLIESKFAKISVELNEGFSLSESSGNSPFELDIEHMTHIERQDSSHDSLQRYVIALGIRSGTDNESLIPYTFEVVVTGIISADPQQFAPGNNIDDSATKYGFSILFGQIRELLTTLTSRMNAGQFTLPTMSFMDATFPIAPATDQGIIDEAG